MNVVVVSRHASAVEFIAGTMRTELVDATVTPGSICLFGRGDTEYAGEDMGTIQVIMDRDATPEDVSDKVVYGNIPMHLASLAHRVCAIEFSGTPPRGREYTLADMLAAGAKLTCYVVKKVDQYGGPLS